ncbi:MAG TPA: aminotransferase class I/II-fold pyridoxal phosphate-dependent enzyme [Candidatus Thermoplasmatota archaeon]|nr:aminotransferase class I/II-fold pyridoxal phosphate-dependent enzyme [Candidatus Thermoplasmatota archaeon]
MANPPTTPYAKRIDRLPLYLFAELERKIAAKRKAGVDVISLGIGDPDLPPPAFIVESVKNHLEDPKCHGYPTSRGELRIREAVARWMKGRFGVEVDPDSEVCVTVGSKEGLSNLARAYVNPGEKVAASNPGYPVYRQSASLLNDAENVMLALTHDNGFLPNLELVKGCRMFFFGYPNNPTGAIAPEMFWKACGMLADTHPETVVVSDHAYCEMTYDDYRSPSLLQYTRNAVEFHSMSKVFNMTGYRVGFAVGRRDIIAGLEKVKSNLDSGTPMWIQEAMAEGLGRYSGATPPKEVKENLAVYAKRRDLMVAGLRNLGLKLEPPKGTFYLWVDVGGEEGPFCDKALDAGVVITPGRGFGEYGKGFIRIALTQPEEKLKVCLERLAGVVAR